jgi:hypothetical protein
MDKILSVSDPKIDFFFHSERSETTSLSLKANPSGLLLKARELRRGRGKPAKEITFAIHRICDSVHNM